MKKDDKEKDDFLVPPEALKKIKSQAELEDFFHIATSIIQAHSIVDAAGIG